LDEKEYFFMDWKDYLWAFFLYCFVIDSPPKGGPIGGLPVQAVVLIDSLIAALICSGRFGQTAAISAESGSRF
jgi:hypothetical protein